MSSFTKKTVGARTSAPGRIGWIRTNALTGYFFNESKPRCGDPRDATLPLMRIGFNILQYPSISHVHSRHDTP